MVGKTINTDLNLSTWDINTWVISPEYISSCVATLINLLNIDPDAEKFVDLGCGRGVLTTSFFEALPQGARLEGVDIEPIFTPAKDRSLLSFVCCDVNKYLSEQQDNCYDGILVKQMFHLLAPKMRALLLNEIYRTLKPGRVALLMIMPSKLPFPMFTSAEKAFEDGQLCYQEIVKLAKSYMFETDLAEFKFHVCLDKTHYIQLIRQRFMSHLRALSVAQIESGIKEFDQLHESDKVEFDDILHIIRMKKPVSGYF